MTYGSGASGSVRLAIGRSFSCRVDAGGPFDAAGAGEVALPAVRFGLSPLTTRFQDVEAGVAALAALVEA